MDLAVVLKCFDQYPDLITFITAGTISLKAAREILNIDRYVMYDLYLELIKAGAVVGSGSNAFRASPELKEYVKEFRKDV